MENVYANKLKKVLETYNNKQKEFEKNIANAKETLLPAIADSKIKEISQKQAITYQQAKESVVTLFDELKGRLARANFPSTEDLSTDRLFFDGSADIDLSIAETKVFLERYKTNATMKKMIKNLILKNHSSKGGEPNDWTILANSISTPERELEEYKKIFNSCLGTINTISQHSVSDIFVDDFCANDNATF